MFAQCEDCGMWVPADITHNGVAYVGHYVHCGWGHICSPDDLRDTDRAIDQIGLDGPTGFAVLDSLDEATRKRVFEMIDAARAPLYRAYRNDV